MQNIASNDPVALVTGIIGAFSAAFAAYKVLDELLNGRYARMKNDIDYFDKLILACKEKEHPLKIEKLFECLYGKRARAEIICQIVNEWPSPSNAIWRYLKSRDLLQFDDEGFAFEGQLEGALYRSVMKKAHLAVYVFFFLLAWLPFNLQLNISKYTAGNYLALISYCGAMLVMSLSSVSYYWKIDVAEKLVEESMQVAICKNKT